MTFGKLQAVHDVIVVVVMVTRGVESVGFIVMDNHNNNATTNKLFFLSVHLQLR